MVWVTIDNTGERFEQGEGHDCLLRAGLAAGLGLSYECNSGGCGSCKFELLEGEVETLWEDAPGLSARDRKKGRRLACQSVARSDVRIKMHSDPEYRLPVPAARVGATLIGCRAVTGDITEFRFQAEGPADFRPGQYALLYLPGVGGPRAYSMSNTPNADGVWEFWIRRVPGGVATSVLFDACPPGQSVEIDGPYGLAYLRPEADRDIVCIAGGSGISPMLSIARAAIAEPALAQRRVHFYFGGRTPQDLCGDPELRELPGYGERLSYRCAVSEASVEAWSGARGYVHELVQRDLGGRLAEMECYFAGPPAMAEALQRVLLLEEGVPQAQIHFDRFF